MAVGAIMTCASTRDAEGERAISLPGGAPFEVCRVREKAG